MLSYCPGSGQSSPTAVAAGSYSTPEGGSETTRTGVTQCSKGEYCSGGVRSQCPAGKYGGSTGLQSLSACTDCDAGYVCAAGSTSAQGAVTDGGAATPCGSAGVYCPVGSSTPTTASPGQFTANDVSGTVGAATTRVTQVACPAGSYCTGGVAQLCPAGALVACQAGAAIAECVADWLCFGW